MIWDWLLLMYKNVSLENNFLCFRIVREIFLELFIQEAVVHCQIIIITFFSIRRASAALNCLKRFHEMKKRGPKPYSLHLDHIIQKAISTHQKRDQYRVQKDIFILKVLQEFIFQTWIWHCVLETWIPPLRVHSM